MHPMLRCMCTPAPHPVLIPVPHRMYAPHPLHAAHTPGPAALTSGRQQEEEQQEQWGRRRRGTSSSRCSPPDRPMPPCQLPWGVHCQQLCHALAPMMSSVLPLGPPLRDHWPQHVSLASGSAPFFPGWSRRCSGHQGAGTWAGTGIWAGGQGPRAGDRDIDWRQGHRLGDRDWGQDKTWGWGLGYGLGTGTWSGAGIQGWGTGTQAGDRHWGWGTGGIWGWAQGYRLGTGIQAGDRDIG